MYHPMIQTLAALAEPNRLRIVELLREGPRPVNDIAASLELQQPQVSKHLKVLKEAGLVEVEQRAQQRRYALRGEPLRALHEWVDAYRGLWDERLDQMEALIEAMKRQEQQGE